MALSKVGDLGNFIRDQRRNARLSLRKMSQMAGISNPYLSQIERGMRRPSAEILQSIAKALRISSETLYVKAGILEERDDSVDVVTALLRDPQLTDKQRRVLIEVYQSFRHENELEAAPQEERAAQPARAKKATAAKPRQRTATTSSRSKSTTPRGRTAATKKQQTRPAARSAKKATS